VALNSLIKAQKGRRQSQAAGEEGSLCPNLVVAKSLPAIDDWLTSIFPKSFEFQIVWRNFRCIFSTFLIFFRYLKITGLKLPLRKLQGNPVELPISSALKFKTFG
jgi:hypothetical protein